MPVRSTLTVHKVKSDRPIYSYWPRSFSARISESRILTKILVFTGVFGSRKNTVYAYLPTLPTYGRTLAHKNTSTVLHKLIFTSEYRWLSKNLSAPHKKNPLHVDVKFLPAIKSNRGFVTPMNNSVRPPFPDFGGGRFELECTVTAMAVY